MEPKRYLAYCQRYALMVICLFVMQQQAFSQKVDLSISSSYDQLPMLDASQVRKDNKLFATLVLNDFSYREYRVKLKMSIKSNGVAISTSNTYNYKTYVLKPGVPLVVNAFELGDYFNPEGLDFRGMDKRTFLDTGVLPEGNYQLCFTVADAEVDGFATLSNEECDFLTLRYASPPEITTDLNDVLDNKMIEWSHHSRYKGDVVYDVEVYEFRGGTGYEMYTYEQPLYAQKDLDGNSADLESYLNSVDRNTLLAFFVRAKNKGISNYYFTNKGYSEPLYFQRMHRSSDCVGEVKFREISGPNGITLLETYVEGCNPKYGGFEVESGYSNIIPYNQGSGYQAIFYCVNASDGALCQISGSYGDVDCLIGTECNTTDGCEGTVSQVEENSDGSLVDYSEWTVGTGSVGKFYRNGSDDETYRILGQDPWGNESVIWEARPDAQSGPDGGWNSGRVDIDNTKTYRLSVWVNRKVRGNNGKFYFGSRGYGAKNGIKRLSNNVTYTNPYFISGGSSILGDGEDEWVLVVAHIHPSSHSGTASSVESGRYKLSGEKFGSVYDFKWLPETRQALHRSYLYYCTDTNVRQQWVYPRFEVVDGSEPTIAELLKGSSCHCESNCTDITIVGEENLQGQIVLSPQLPESCTEAGQGDIEFLWSNGEKQRSIIAVEGVSYSLEASCGDGCCYTGTYNDSSNCYPGAWCDDNNACTINDVTNDSCDCVGEPIAGCTSTETLSGCEGILSIDVTADSQGGNLLTAKLSGTNDVIEEYRWNGSNSAMQSFHHSTSQSNFSLEVLCTSGCTYSAELSLTDCSSEGEVQFKLFEGANGEQLLHAFVDGCEPVSGGILTGSGYASTVPYVEGNGYQADYYCVNPNGGPLCQISGTYGSSDCLIGTSCITELGCEGVVGESTGGLLDYSTWTEGTGVSGNFNLNGSLDENHRIQGRDPWGNPTILWEARPNGSGGADGGWNAGTINIDHTKTYRMSVWVNRKVRGENGRFYLGARGYGTASGLKNIADDKTNTNPYFYYSNPTASGLGPEDEWVLVVGHIYPSSHTGTSRSPESGRYTLSEGKIGEIQREYKWLPQTTRAVHRSYLYYAKDTDVRQQWVYPRFDLVDGSEPSIADLLSNTACMCEESCSMVEIREDVNSQGQTMLYPDLPENCNPSEIKWSNGSNQLSIIATPGISYSFEAKCADGCCYSGIFDGGNNCWPGTWCDDGDPCTNNDKLDEDCNCIGIEIDGCDPTNGCFGDLSINVTTDPQGGSFLTANLSAISCSVDEYIWNGNPSNNQPYYYSGVQGLVSLTIRCTTGCTYSAQVWINGDDIDNDLLCSQIEVTEIDDCVYEVTYPDIIEPACDLELGPNGVTHALCGNPTGRIVINPEEGNEPYHYTWSTGGQGYENTLGGLSAGDYSVTVTDITGCEVTTSVTIVDAESVSFSASGGDGGLEETLVLPAGMGLVWKFNPITVADQFVLSGQSLLDDTGAITRSKEEDCSASCSCALVFMGDYQDGDALPIASGEAFKAGSYAANAFYVPSNGIIDLTVYGGSCTNGTGWSLKLECYQQEPLISANDSDFSDPSYVKYPMEVSEMISAGQLSRDQFERDSIAYRATAIFEKVDTKGKTTSRNDIEESTTILDFSCSGFAVSPYTITMYNSQTGEYFDCDIIDLLECKECDQYDPCNGSVNISVSPSTIIDNIQLTAENSCEEVGTYQWSNGSIAHSISVPMNSGPYSVTVTCEDCEYIAFYENDACVEGVLCNDGDPCTSYDVYNASCDCIGVPLLDENGDPLTDCDEDPCSASLNIDVEPSTEINNIILTANNSCADVSSYAWSNGSTEASITVPMLGETYSVTVTCGDCEYVGTYLNDICVSSVLCDDENGCTVLDAYDDNCNCVGTPLEDLSCTDNDPCTINDTYDEDCNCIGTQLYEADGMTPLTDCDETNPCDAEVSIEVSSTSNYSEVLLTALSDCENANSNEVTTYEWSTGSSESSILVSSQSGEYAVIVTCGDCQYVVTYNTDGCLVGLPCDDGLDCTENDAVQENCECHGTNIEEAEFDFSTELVYKQSCDYQACLPSFNVYSKFVVTSIDVILEDGTALEINKGMNSQGFDFPYCMRDPSSSCDGLPGVAQLADDLSDWLGTEATSSVAISNNYPCYIPNAINIKYNTFIVESSTIEFVAINGYNDFIEELSFQFEDQGCENGMTAIGVNVTTTIDCETTYVDEDNNTITVLPIYEWSDGTQSNIAYIPYVAGTSTLAYCLEVSATCMNGCTYTATYGENCENCIYGESCDDGQSCTINDAINDDCDCVGQPMSDSDNDGVCDVEDVCPLGDDHIDLDGNGIPDACDTDIDCDDLLTASIDVEVSNESCSYCLLINDPIFLDEDVDIDVFLYSVSIVENGQPKTLSATTSPSFDFPYFIDESLSTLVPSNFLNDINTYLGPSGNFSTNNNPLVGGCADWIVENNGPVGSILIEDVDGPVLYGNVDLPTVLQSITFVWGGNNFITKYFYNPDPCEDLANPFTLEASLEENCGGELSYEWSTGQTSSSIQVPSLAGVYTVTVTCGVCSDIATTTPVDGEEGCTVGASCYAVDDCDVPYSGFLDAYCHCINDNPTVYPDEDGDGIPDCIDCPVEDTQVSFEGEEICCDNPPALIYDAEPTYKTLYNFCKEIKEDKRIFAIRINGQYISQANNYDPAEGDVEDNFFHFPYCVEDNCDYYGDNIEIPYTLKNLNRLAYDLQKWANYNGYKFTTSTVRSDLSCDKCGDEENTLYINGNHNGDDIVLSFNDGDEKMEVCRDDNAFAGYYVRFAPYDEEEEKCTVTSLYVDLRRYNQPINIVDGDGIDLSQFKFGPVPHKGVGFKAIVQCARGCVYEVVTEDADCIVGEPCDSADPCASKTYMSFDHEDCDCIVLESHDRDEDGVCDDDDQCPPELPIVQGYNYLYDDNIDYNNNGVPDGCENCDWEPRTCDYCVGLPLNDDIDNLKVKGFDITHNGNQVGSSLNEIIQGLPAEICIPLNNGCFGFNLPETALITILNQWIDDNGYTGTASIEFSNTGYYPCCPEILDVKGGGTSDGGETSRNFGARCKIISIEETDLEFNSMYFTQGAPYIFEEYNCKGGPEECDDGWDCTVDDHYDENCNCVGTFMDSDNDTVCDEEDACDGFPDHFDTDNDGVPDGCETVISVECEPEDIPYCKFLNQLLEDSYCTRKKVLFNNLIEINDYLEDKLAYNQDMLVHLPFPELKRQLESGVSDIDNDGIVNILDPVPYIPAYTSGSPISIGTHDFTSPEVIEDVNKFCEWGPSAAYIKERAILLNMFLYTVNPGVLVGTNPDDSDNPIVSGCFDEKKSQYQLTEGDYNDAGYFYSGLTKCYVYFELDCSCNCVVKESTALNLVDERCEDVVVGDECTTDLANTLHNEDGTLALDDDGNPQSSPGYHYVECPPADGDPCAIYSIVSNPDYDPYNPGDEKPCECQRQIQVDGSDSETIDSDGDGVCDLIDQCPGADDNADIDGDGIPDCVDLCPNLQGPISTEFTKEGYAAPSGPGDVCDDGDPCTYDDVITQECECRGVYIDSDDDGVYDCEECVYVIIDVQEIPVIVDGVQLIENGQPVTISKNIYDWGTKTIEVDAIGNLVTADTPLDEIRTLVNCDVCPGIPDGDPLDQDDFPMDYNNNGLPDCIDPPFKPICPDDYEITSVGLILRFNTDDLDEESYPEPITFQGIQSSNSTSSGFEVGYLVVSFAREVEDEVTGEIYTEVVYQTEDFGANSTGDFDQVNIVYSDHQSCSLGGGTLSSLPCPTQFNGASVIFEIDPGVEIDLSELVGSLVFDTPPFELETNASNFTIKNGDFEFFDYSFTVNQIANPYTGTITLPSGQVCTYDNGVMPICTVMVDNQTLYVSPGDPCDDGDECTNHDKWNADCQCEGVPNPDEDNDGFCDAIDPCPEDFNVMPASGDVADIDDCPCPELELSTLEGELAGLQDGNDFYAYFGSDLSGYSNITIEVDNGQDDPVDPTDGNGVEPVSPIVIGNLQGGYTYTITVTADCPYGTSQEVVLEVDVPFGDNPIVCGVEIDEVDLSTYSLLPKLNSGETFVASDFEVSVKTSAGSFGKFKGKGYIKVPFFNQARLNVKFNNIIISSDRQMIDGFIEVDGFGLAILGDDLSDAINGSLDGIIGVLEDIGTVLEELIPILEDIEDLIEEVGHLGDPMTIQCIQEKTALLEELIALTEASPEPSEEQLDQIKLDIEKVSAELKKCKDDLDDQIEAILLSVSDFIPYFIHQVAVVDGMCGDLASLEADYDLNNDKYRSQFDDDVDELIGIWSQSNSGLESPEKVSTFELEVSNPIFDEEDLEAYYVETILQFDFCRAVTSLDLGYQSIDLSTPAGVQEKLDRTKVFLEILTEAGSVLSNELSEKKKNGDSNESIYAAHKEELVTAFKNVIIKKAYKN